MYSIRPARPDDAPTLLRLIRELAAYEREPDAVQATEASLRAQLEAASPPFECRLGCVEGEPRAFALFFSTYSTWRGRVGIWLEDLYVQPEFRGQGLGLRLFSEVARLARERGAARLELCALDWNTPAIRFYERLGARPMAEWTTYRLGDEAIDRLADLAPRPDPVDR
ncbi:MAG: GNAT family N-acetyltransferase [Myxococcales bacterium]|nr:GNAT family N-acetyltransferase [Myxococcales bacterium]